MKQLTIIGRVEYVALPTLGISRIPAKIDTGADVSSIWCSKVEVVGNELHCIFLGPGVEGYKGSVHKFKKKEFTVTRVYNSFGHGEIRYKVKIPVMIANRRINATFTLSDRSQKLFPVLIGNTAIRGKFLVDASKDGPLKAQEKEDMNKLKAEMSDFLEETTQ